MSNSIRSFLFPMFYKEQFQEFAMIQVAYGLMFHKFGLAWALAPTIGVAALFVIAVLLFLIWMAKIYVGDFASRMSSWA